MRNRLDFLQQFEEEFEQDTCSVCELIEDYLVDIAHANNFDELEFLLHDLVNEAFKEGYVSALNDDIEIKMELLDDLYKD